MQLMLFAFRVNVRSPKFQGFDAKGLLGVLWGAVICNSTGSGVLATVAFVLRHASELFGDIGPHLLSFQIDMFIDLR